MSWSTGKSKENRKISLKSLTDRIILPTRMFKVNALETVYVPFKFVLTYIDNRTYLLNLQKSQP